MGIFPLCNMHHFGLQNGLFQGLKSTISHPEIGLIGLRNGHYQKAILIFSDYGIWYINRRYGVKQAL